MCKFIHISECEFLSIFIAYYYIYYTIHFLFILSCCSILFSTNLLGQYYRLLVTCKYTISMYYIYIYIKSIHCRNLTIFATHGNCHKMTNNNLSFFSGLL